MDSRNRQFLILFAIFSLVYLIRFKKQSEFNFKPDQLIKITAVLNQEPKIQGRFQLFNLKAIFIKTNSLPEYHYGDKLTATGRITKKEINPVFSQYWLINPEITKINPYNKKLSSERSILSYLFKFRDKLEQIFKKSLPEPQASLLTGIVLGIQKSVPYDFYQALKTTGTLHIIVASGMNISLTAGLVVDFLTKFLHRKPALIIATLIIIIYCIISGLGPPIIRAGLMAFCLYLAVFLGREAVGLWVLGLTAAVMLIFDPFLLFDTGFQLSFSATAGILLISQNLEKWFNKLGRPISIISNPLAETASAQIFTLPILVITFGNFNPLSIIPNLFVIPLVPYLMILGLLIAFLGLIIFPLAQSFSLLAWLALTYFIKVIIFFGQFKILNLQLKNLSWLFGIGYYLILTSLLTKRTKRFNPKG